MVFGATRTLVYRLPYGVKLVMGNEHRKRRDGKGCGCCICLCGGTGQEEIAIIGLAWQAYGTFSELTSRQVLDGGSDFTTLGKLCF